MSPRNVHGTGEQLINMQGFDDKISEGGPSDIVVSQSVVYYLRT